ncbi:uncharacterized protein LOC133645971 [Entelurus aequoreus]|uniref:uncharacterized protein LOC133645971 n=1 Tax=Entelurus aequoreus TaxID=161455 RepID=UPI002B1D73E5|nr:uncharacterized protein LOC133645971 [Entelurus aequoreus]
MEHIQPPGVHAGCTTLEHQASPYLPAHENISTFDSIKENGKPFSRSALIDPPDGLTTELHVDAEYDPSQSFEESLPDMGDWMYNDRHTFNEGFEDSLSEECAEESNIKDTTDKPIYDNVSVTMAECLLIIMCYVNCHKVTDKALSDLLKMFKLLCPDSLNADCLNSVQKFKNFFLSRSASSPILLHKYCSNCFGPLESKQIKCLSCGTSVSEERSSSFIEVPIKAQIRSLFLKPGFQEKLNFRLSRKKADANNIEDIYDAEVYKQLVDRGGPLSDPKNISLTWNTDEDKNGYLLRLIHGTQNIPMQMVNVVKLVQSIPVISQTIKPGNVIAEFYRHMTKDDSFCQENKYLSRIKLYGASSELLLDTVHLSALQIHAGHCINSGTVSIFHRAQVKKYLGLLRYCILILVLIMVVGEPNVF